MIRCRECKTEASVVSVDQYVGSCAGDVMLTIDGELEFEPGGYTEIDWNSAEFVGWQCMNCFTSSAPLDEVEDNDMLALARLVEVVMPEPKPALWERLEVWLSRLMPQ